MQAEECLCGCWDGLYFVLTLKSTIKDNLPANMIQSARSVVLGLLLSFICRNCFSYDRFQLHIWNVIFDVFKKRINTIEVIILK